MQGEDQAHSLSPALSGGGWRGGRSLAQEASSHPAMAASHQGFGPPRAAAAAQLQEQQQQQWEPRRAEAREAHSGAVPALSVIQGQQGYAVVAGDAAGPTWSRAQSAAVRPSAMQVLWPLGKGRCQAFVTIKEFMPRVARRGLRRPGWTPSGAKNSVLSFQGIGEVGQAGMGGAQGAPQAQAQLPTAASSEYQTPGVAQHSRHAPQGSVLLPAQGALTTPHAACPQVPCLPLICG